MSAGSWVTSANRPDHDFPIQNLPYGAFRMPGEAFRCGGKSFGVECTVGDGATSVALDIASLKSDRFT